MRKRLKAPGGAADFSMEGGIAAKQRLSAGRMISEQLNESPGKQTIVMNDAEDPRIYFAAERTLLAWIRTGLTVIGLGFVVARFGLFLQMVAHGPEAKGHWGSTTIGVGLVVLGAVAVGMGAWQHVRFIRTLSKAERPQHYAMLWPVWFAALLTAVGLVLATYLVIRSEFSG